MAEESDYTARHLQYPPRGADESFMSTDTPSVETHRFQAEVNQVLHLVINSLYSHKEVFLRELVSNASDALDKLRFRSLTDAGLMEGDNTLEIRVYGDPKSSTLTIEDTGVGMTHDELVENLGTIAHSGSKKFLEMAKQRGEKSDVNLIGQFGVGFYSAWLVADHVEVITRAAGDSQAWRWTSDAKESFTLEPAAREKRGTSVILHLKDDHKEFAESWRLRDLISRYSDFVAHPILLRKDHDEKKSEEWETANQASALWQRSKSDVTDEQYRDFYKHLTNDHEDPLAWTHFRVEGSQEFAGLVYIPSHPPYDLDVNPGEARKGIRLFVKRVFIMDDCEALTPPWLRFMRGVLDSDDLPLNVSRETLQDSSVVRAIKKQVTKKTLDLLDELARDRADDYKTFWTHYGRILKEALHTEWDHRDRVASLARYESSHGEGLTSLADYVSRMPASQEAIYYILGESRKAVADSPHIESLRQKGYEVLYMTDLVDTWASEGLREFQGKRLVSALDANLKVEDDEAAKQVREGYQGVFRTLFDRVQKVLGERVREVKVSDRLTDSPACLVVPPGGINATLERVLRAHGREVPPSKKILEVNPKHPLIEALRTVAEREPESPQVGEWIEMLYDQALLTEGNPIDDPQRFARRLTGLMQQAVQGAAAKTESAT